jgi:NarL family two-component system response regulator YdfI
VIRVFIVASSTLARAGLRDLARSADVEVIGGASDFESLAGQWPDLEPDVILVEASEEEFPAAIDFLSNFELASESAVVILSDRIEPKWLLNALRAGVRAVLPSDISAGQLVSAIHAAAAGLTVIHSAEVAAVAPAEPPASRPLADLAEPLTPRETEVLQMLASGLANKEIAGQLKISEHTAKFHVASILGKLGAGSRTEAVAIGIRRGLVLL